MYKVPQMVKQEFWRRFSDLTQTLITYKMYLSILVCPHLSENEFLYKLCYLRKARGSSCGKETLKDTLVVSILYTYITFQPETEQGSLKASQLYSQQSQSDHTVDLVANSNYYCCCCCRAVGRSEYSVGGQL